MKTFMAVKSIFYMVHAHLKFYLSYSLFVVFFFLSIPSFSVPRESRVTTLAGPWPFEQFLCLAE